MTSLARFSQNIRKRGSQIENAGARVIRRAARKSLKSLVLNTPVDTGRARSNWRVSLTVPTRAVIPPYSPGRKLGISEGANARAAIAAGNRQIELFRPGRGRLVSTALYIVNNVSYIDKLNAGSSKQMSAGFIERALLEASLTIQNFRVFGAGGSDGD